MGARASHETPGISTCPLPMSLPLAPHDHSFHSRTPMSSVPFTTQPLANIALLVFISGLPKEDYKSTSNRNYVLNYSIALATNPTP